MDTLEKTLLGFKPPINEGTNKIKLPGDAIKEFIHAKDYIHLGVTHGMPYGLSNELIRQFHGTDPQFTFSAMGALNHLICMIRLNMVKKMITTYAGDIYPAPGPNRIFDEVWKKGLDIEQWSVLSLTQRFMGAALGMQFVPTNSLANSSMGEDNAKQGDLAFITNPFNPEQRQTVLRPLHPDVTLLHGWVADPYGNTILTPPLSESPWGVYAAKKVIISVEKIVDTEFIRRYNHLVRIPGFMVDAVCEMPFGAHPGGLSINGLQDVPFLQMYAEDYDFIVNFRKQTKEDATLDAYINEWILGCKSQQEYLKHLGNERMEYLRGRAQPTNWQKEINAINTKEAISTDSAWIASENMILTASREMANICQSKAYKTILAGQGASNLAAWLAMYKLHEKGVDLDLLAELGFVGYAPRPGSPFIFNFANIPTCKMTTDSLTSMGVFMGGPRNTCLGALGAAQIDVEGNINSTLARTPDGKRIQFLVGSGGANDVLSSARETVIVMPSKGGTMRFLQNVPYITGPGARVAVLVTDQGVFKKQDGTFMLEKVIPPNPNEKDLETLIKAIKRNTGWRPFKTAEKVTLVEDPTPEELHRLRVIDARKNFLRA